MDIVYESRTHAFQVKENKRLKKCHSTFAKNSHAFFLEKAAKLEKKAQNARLNASLSLARYYFNEGLMQEYLAELRVASVFGNLTRRRIASTTRYYESDLARQHAADHLKMMESMERRTQERNRANVIARLSVNIPERTQEPAETLPEFFTFAQDAISQAVSEIRRVSEQRARDERNRQALENEADMPDWLRHIEPAQG